MACEVNNKEINSQCAELLVRPTYISQKCFQYPMKLVSIKLYAYCMKHEQTKNRQTKDKFHFINYRVY